MINEIEFRKQKFKTYGIIEIDHEKGLFRVPIGEQPHNRNLIALREEIRDIIWEKADEYRNKNNVKISDFGAVEMCCRIPVDTVKKAVNGKYNITRNFLAKFSVGLKLDLDTANQLFKYHSGELNLTNDFDYVVYYALETKDDIDFFIEEVETYTGMKLDRDKS
jgi:hypothetical protein